MNKPIASSAASTAFCAVKLEGPDRFLWIDGNGKITAGNGTLDNPNPNAFSLVEIEDCPGSTETCRAACYVHGLKKHAPETHALYQHNSVAIREILSRDAIGKALWAGVMARWIVKNCAGGFRWHVSGDVFSESYASWIALVCRFSPGVRHWIYTRSFDFAQPLIGIPNLTVNVSADKDNWNDAVRFAQQHELRICYLTDDGKVPIGLVEGDVIFPDYSLRGGTERGQGWFSALFPDYKSYVCPVDYHGKAENRRCGPCDRCLHD